MVYWSRTTHAQAGTKLYIPNLLSLAMCHNKSEVCLPPDKRLEPQATVLTLYEELI